MALTDIVEQELLATLDGSGDPQAVLDRYADSKGPLYPAVARATAQATARFGDARGKLREAQARLQATEAQARDAEKRAVQAKRQAATADKRLASPDAALARRQSLLDRADALQAAGFDAAALARLVEALGAGAQAEGKPVAEVVSAFLDAAADWRTLAELRGKVAEAKKAAEDAERQARGSRPKPSSRTGRSTRAGG